MTLVHYTAEVKSGLLLELPTEAQALHLKPGDMVEVQLEARYSEPLNADNDASIALLEAWLADAPTESDAICEAEADLREFKRNMNLPRKETGARLHYPEVE